MLALDFGLHKPVALVDAPTATYCEFGIHTPRALLETPRYHAWVCESNSPAPYVLRTLPSEAAGASGSI